MIFRLFKVKNLRYLGGVAMFYLIRGTVFLVTYG